jgi:hypothetical protein
MNLLEYFYRGTKSGKAPPQAPATRSYLEKAVYSVRCGFAIIAGVLEYWIVRWSLSSGGALRRPGGGR